MSKMRPIRPRVLIFFAAMTAFACAIFDTGSAQNPTNIQGALSRLADRMYVTGETTGRLADFENSINEARKSIKDLVATNSSLLTERGQVGTTPLIMAASLGYDGIVEELLAYKQVKDTINEVDSRGISAWVFANFAAQEALWVCNRMVLNDPYKLIPKVVQRPYYSRGSEPPYVKVRRMLEGAGARHDMDEAKRLWASVCEHQDSETKQAVASSSDLLTYVRKASQEKLAAFLKDAAARGNQK